ncbi:peptidase inhibitor family I36 protein [Demetria terragena]|uniref:peptidase inhibitor family I36 protein n=1 Tax=Demetria terragena TaxID=63959 RepID=UPI00036C89DE|nr:peptidase inhibitor family I36 protein [Demetria terragena]
MRSIKNRTAVIMGTIALAGAGVTGVSLSDSAQATDRDGNCDAGEFCYNYNSDLGGAWSDFSSSVANYGTDQPGCYEFKGNGKGESDCIKNDAGGFWNRSGKPVTIYYHSYFGGHFATVENGDRGRLPQGVYNENASHRIGASPAEQKPDQSPTPSGTSVGEASAPRSNPHPPQTSSAPDLTERSKFIRYEVSRGYGGAIQCDASAYRSHEGSTSNHNTGNALDCTVGNKIGSYPNSLQKANGWVIAKWMKKYSHDLKIHYVIWDGKIWSVARSNEGWRPYKAATDVTGGHYDHIHVSVQNPHGDGDL